MPSSLFLVPQLFLVSYGSNTCRWYDIIAIASLSWTKPWLYGGWDCKLELRNTVVTMHADPIPVWRNLTASIAKASTYDMQAQEG